MAARTMLCALRLSQRRASDRHQFVEGLRSGSSAARPLQLADLYVESERGFDGFDGVRVAEFAGGDL